MKRSSRGFTGFLGGRKQKEKKHSDTSGWLRPCIPFGAVSWSAATVSQFFSSPREWTAAKIHRECMKQMRKKLIALLLSIKLYLESKAS